MYHDSSMLHSASFSSLTLSFGMGGGGGGIMGKGYNTEKQHLNVKELGHKLG